MNAVDRGRRAVRTTPKNSAGEPWRVEKFAAVRAEPDAGEGAGACPLWGAGRVNHHSCLVLKSATCKRDRRDATGLSKFNCSRLEPTGCKDHSLVSANVLKLGRQGENLFALN